MSDQTFTPPQPIVFPDSTVFPDVKFFTQALASLDADDAEIANENKSLNQLVADLTAQLVIAQGLLQRNQKAQDNQDATRAFIQSRMPTPPPDAVPAPVETPAG